MVDSSIIRYEWSATSYFNKKGVIESNCTDGWGVKGGSQIISVNIWLRDASLAASTLYWYQTWIATTPFSSSYSNHGTYSPYSNWYLALPGISEVDHLALLRSFNRITSCEKMRPSSLKRDSKNRQVIRAIVFCFHTSCVERFRRSTVPPVYCGLTPQKFYGNFAIIWPYSSVYSGCSIVL